MYSLYNVERRFDDIKILKAVLYLVFLLISDHFHILWVEFFYVMLVVRYRFQVSSANNFVSVQF